jgi:hypothetical protein
VELVAVLPVLLLCALLAAQAVVVGWALWSAGIAARAAARAQTVGRDPERAARAALPPSMRSGAEVTAGDLTRVSVPIPALVPGARLPSVSASAGLDAGDG